MTGTDTQNQERRATMSVASEKRLIAGENPPDTVLALLALQRALRPLAPAFIYLPDGSADEEPVRLTYDELVGRVVQIANLLHAHGIRPDRPVTLMLPNLIDAHLLLWAGAIAGTVNPVNPFLSVEQIAGIMRQAGSRTLIAPPTTLEPELARKARDVARHIDGVATLFVAGPAEPDAESLDACSRYPADRLAFDRAIHPDDVAALLHTGGTTGTPKLVRQTHRNLMTVANLGPSLMGIQPGDVVLTGLPLFHTNAAVITGLSTFAAGGTVLLAGRQGFRSRETIAAFWRIVERYRVSTFCAVPTILSSLLQVPQAGADVSSLTVALCGAAPLALAVLQAFEEATGLRILEGYGLTETSALCAVNPLGGECRLGSVGLPIPGVEIAPVVLDGTGAYVRDCAVGEVGILLVHGDNVTPGYKSSDHNAKIWAKPGWLNTGDRGRVDAQGYIWLAGREKDLIIRGGHNIDPATIEEALALHPAVDLVAGVGRPDTYAGEVPVAFVTLRAGLAVTPDELKAFAREHVSEPAASPATIIILETMPLTAVGKIFKPTLRERAAEQAVRTTLELAGLSNAVHAIEGRHDALRGLVVAVRVTPGSAPAVSRSDAARLLLVLEVHDQPPPDGETGVSGP